MSNTFLGTSMNTPVAISNGRAVLVSDKESIEQSIKTILTTPKGTRLLLPEFGSRLEELLFEPNDEVVKSLARLFIFEAIRDWEKRVKFKGVQFVRESEEILNCIIEYEILASNEIDSFIYPYYKELKF